MHEGGWGWRGNVKIILQARVFKRNSLTWLGPLSESRFSCRWKMHRILKQALKELAFSKHNYFVEEAFLPQEKKVKIKLTIRDFLVKCSLSLILFSESNLRQ